MGVWLGIAGIAIFVAWGALLFWRGRAEEVPTRQETRRERRRLQHRG